MFGRGKKSKSSEKPSKPTDKSKKSRSKERDGPVPSSSSHIPSKKRTNSPPTSYGSDELVNQPTGLVVPRKIEESRADWTFDLSAFKTDADCILWATSENDIATLPAIIASGLISGAQVPLPAPLIETALFVAASSDAIDCFSFLLAQPAAPPSTVLDSSGWSLLFTAARYGSPNVFRALHNLSCDPRFRDPQGFSLYEAAYWGGSLDVVSILGPPPQEDAAQLLPRCLNIAVQEGHLPLVAHLIEAVQPQFAGAVPLHVLVDQPFDAKRPPPVYVAAMRGFDEIVRALLAGGANPGPHVGVEEDRTPLHAAVLSRNERSCALLLGHRKIDPNPLDAQGHTPLYYAANTETPCFAIIDALFLGGASPLPSGVISDVVLQQTLTQAYFVASLRNFQKESQQDPDKSLALAQCDLDLVPPEIATEAPNIRQLLLPRNRIKQTGGIGMLRQLVVLDLSQNLLAGLSPDIGELKQLVSLDLSNNQLTELPLEIGGCMSLQRLVVAQNKLGALPESIGQLFRTLRFLDVSNNQLNDFPRQLSLIPEIDLLWHNNPLKNLPKELFSQGTPGLINYLTALNRGEYKCYQAKILVVGKENVGKTNLIQALRNTSPKVSTAASSGTQFQVDDSTPVATDGIEIQQWIEHGTVDNARVELSLSFWDFAGQEVYYSTHQLFLSARSVYLLTFHTLEHDFDRTEYWLRAIYSRIEKPVIFLVATHLDLKACTEQHRSALQAMLMERFVRNPAYPGIRGIVEISSKTKRNIDLLRGAIIEAALTLPHMGTLLPCTYRVFERELELARVVRKPPICSWTDLVSIAAQCGIVSAQEVAGLDLSSDDLTKKSSLSSVVTAATLFHDLGIIVCFPESDSPKLRSVVVLDPRFIVLSMATVVSLKNTMVKAGRLYRRDWAFIWRPPTYPPSIHETLVEILHSFEVLFEMPPERTESPPVASPSDLIPKRSTSKGKSGKRPKPKASSTIKRSAKSAETISKSSIRTPTTPRLGVSSPAGTLPPCQPQVSTTSIIPGLLPPDPPPELDVLWNRFRATGCFVPGDSPSRSLLIGRSCQFEFIPSGMFARLLVRVMSLWDRPIFELLWANGIVIRGSTSALLQCFPSEGRIEVYVAGDRSTYYLRIILEQIAALVEETFSFQNRHYQKFAVCPHCLSSPSRLDIFSLPLDDCLSAIMNKQPFLFCQGWRPIPVDQIVPDLSLSDVPQIDSTSLLKDTIVGTGGFGEVWRATIKGSDTVVAMKTLLTKEKDHAELFTSFCREVVIMSLLHHPNIVSLLYVTLTPEISLVAEMISCGDLFRHIKRLRTEPNAIPANHQPFIFRVALEIAAGMKYLHTRFPPIIHRDLKSPNILLASLDPMSPHPIAKVADFGIAGNVLSSKQKGGGDEFSYWQPPEILNRESYTLSADIYSFGIILSELFSLQEPFTGLLSKFNTFFKIRQAIRDGLRPTLPSDMLPQIRKLTEECWVLSPPLRPTFTNIYTQLLNIHPTLPYHAQLVVLPAPASSSHLIERMPAAPAISPSCSVSTQDLSATTSVITESSVAFSHSSSSSKSTSVTFFPVSFFLEAKHLLLVATSAGKLLVFDTKTTPPRYVTSHSTSHSGKITDIKYIPGPPEHIWSICSSGVICMLTLDHLKVKKSLKTDSSKASASDSSAVMLPLSNNDAVLVLRNRSLLTLNPLGVILTSTDLHLGEIDTRSLMAASPKSRAPSDYHPLFPPALASIGPMITVGLLVRDLLWVCTNSGMILRLDHVKGRRVSRWQAHAGSISSIIQVDSHVWTACSEGVIQVWDAATGRFLRAATSGLSSLSPVLSLVATPHFIISTTAGGSVYVWNKWTLSLLERKECRSVFLSGRCIQDNFVCLSGRDPALTCFQLSATSQTFVSSSLAQLPQAACSSAFLTSAPLLSLASPLDPTSSTVVSESSQNESPLAAGLSFSTLEDVSPILDRYECRVFAQGAFFLLIDGKDSQVSDPALLKSATDGVLKSLPSVKFSDKHAAAASLQTFHQSLLSALKVSSLSIALGFLLPPETASGFGSFVGLIQGSVRLCMRSSILSRVLYFSPQSTAQPTFVQSALSTHDAIMAFTDGAWRQFDSQALNLPNPTVDPVTFFENSLSDLTSGVQLTPTSICDLISTCILNSTCYHRLSLAGPSSSSSSVPSSSAQPSVPPLSVPHISYLDNVSFLVVNAIQSK